MTSAGAQGLLTGSMQTVSSQRPSLFFSLDSNTRSSNWPNAGNVWATSKYSTNNARREAPAATGSNGVHAYRQSGSGALLATSEAEPWSSRPGPWASVDDNIKGGRGATGASASSTSSRNGSSLLEYNNGRPQLGSQTQGSLAIGQMRGGYMTQPRHTASLDDTSRLMPHAHPPDYSNEKDVLGGLEHRNMKNGQAAGFGNERRLPNENSFLSNGRLDQNDPDSSHADTQPPVQSPLYQTEFSNPPRGQNGNHSHRPSLGGQSFPFPAQVNRDVFQRNAAINALNELPDRMSSVSLTDEHTISPHNTALRPSFGNKGQPFKFNPVSQPWEGVKSTGSYGHGARGSPASMSQRSGTSSPRYRGNDVEYLSSPPTRDLNTCVEHAQVSQVPHLLPHLAQQALIAQAYYGLPYACGYFSFPGGPSETHATARQSVLPHPLLVNPTHYLTAGTSGLGLRSKHGRDGIRSSLLEEFKANNSKALRRYGLRDIKNLVVEFCGDQNGSRFIQGKLETSNSEEKDAVFQELRPNAIPLMRDPFGNYVIQKFFEHGSQVQKNLLAGAMKGKVLALSTDVYACRVVQKALEYVLVEQKAEIVEELQGDILRVIQCQNGNHVVQKVIEQVSRGDIDFIMDSFRGRVVQLANQKYSCRVIQRALEHGSDADKAVLTAEVHAGARELIQDDFGNYVAQHVIVHGAPEDRARMIRLVTDNAVQYSKHKFASNVMEKCIESATPEQRAEIVSALSAPGPDGNPWLQSLMKDSYGNYVIQKIVNTLGGEEQRTFLRRLYPYVEALKRSGMPKQCSFLERLHETISMQPEVARMGPLSSELRDFASSLNETPASTAPTSPALRVDLSSASATPNLTTELNTPSSSSPSSVGGYTVENLAGSMKPLELSGVQGVVRIGSMLCIQDP